jgi:hypothetical protein
MSYARRSVVATPAVLDRSGAGDDRSAPPPRPDLLTPAMIALALTPMVVMAVHMLRSDFFPPGDLAATEMLTRDVGSRTPSLGPYSRDGWFHPGPALFYALTPAYRVFGRDGAALAVGALMINAASVGAMGILARRRGGTGLMLATLVGCAVLTHALGPTFLATPWNVYVTVLPYGALLFLVWALVRGERWALPWATVVVSFLMQTHVGYVALALPLWAVGVAWAVGAAVVDRRRRRGDEAPADLADEIAPVAPAAGGHPAVEEPDEPADTGTATARPPSRRGGLVLPAAVAAIVAAAMWLPPAVQQVTDADGNLSRIVDWFGNPGEDARTLLEGWRVVADQYSVPPEWIAGAGPLAITAEPAVVYETVIPVLLVPVLAAVVVLWRRRGWAARALAGTWAAASVVGVVATARTVGLLYAYRLHWAWVLGMLGGVLVLWCGWALATDRAPVVGRRAATAVGVAALAAMALVTSVDATSAEVPIADASALVAGLVGDTEAAVDDLPGGGPVLVDMGSFGAVSVGMGLVAELERRGIDVVVDGGGVGAHRQHTPGEPIRGILHVGINTDVATAASLTDRELVALAGDIDLAGLREDQNRRAELDRQLSTGAITAEEFVRRSADLRPPYSAAAVFLQRTAAAPTSG